MSVLQVLTRTSRQFSRKVGACKATPQLSRCYCETFKQQLIRTAIMTSEHNLTEVWFQGTEGSYTGSKISFSTYTNQTSSCRTSRANSVTDADALDPVEIAKGIFFQGLQTVIPTTLINSQVQVEGSLLKFKDEDATTIDLSRYDKKYVVGFGKACLPMAETLELLLHNHVDRCIISVPVGSRKCKNNRIEVHSGAKDNIPDEDSFTAAKAIVDLAQSCTEKDLLIVLISGGGSALFPYPIPPITLAEKQELIKKLSKAGCTINELNTVRKRLSLVKGGGLVEMCNAGKIISLIISDVSGSPLQVIASGPTVENFDPPNAARSIIEKYGLGEELPSSIREIHSKPPTLQNNDNFANVTNFIIGDNKIALEAAATAAKKYGLRPFIITTTMCGEAADVGYNMAHIAEALAFCMNHEDPKQTDDPFQNACLESIKTVFNQNNWSTRKIIPEILEECHGSSKGICLLFGGETTVTVRGNGKGGRNQELALSAGIKLDQCKNVAHVKDMVAILSAGTDGFDGPNNAAGAVIESATMHNAQQQGLSPVAFLQNNDSFNFFQETSQGKYHILCGHTETNVMDIAIIVILKKSIKKDLRRKSML